MILSCCKQQNVPCKWYCQACAVMLTSKTQAQEHFFGKRHQNVIKSNLSYYSGFKADEEGSPEGKSQIGNNELQHSSESSLRANFESVYGSYKSECATPPPAGRDNILETVLKSENKTFYSSDYSIYRTPSGRYYCQPCNRTVNSQTQFLQHSESRKHKHKASKACPRIKDV